MNEQAMRELPDRVARQEERMNTHQVRYENAVDGLRSDIARRDAAMAERDAVHQAEWARRDKGNLRWMITMWIATIVVMGILIRLPF